MRIIFFILLIPLTVFAQPKEIGADIVERNIRFFRGKIEDVHEIALKLEQTETDKYHAVLTLLKSGENISFQSGYSKGKNLLLMTDSMGKDGNYLLLKWEGEQLKGEWHSQKEDHFLKSVSLKENEKERTIPTHCGKNMWFRTYNGSNGKSDFYLQLQRMAENRIIGSIYVINDKQTYSISGDIDEWERIQGIVWDNNHKKIATLKGTFKSGNALKIQYLPKRKDLAAAFDCVLLLQDDLMMECMDFLDKNGSYDATFPKTKEQKLNEWMEQTVQKRIQAFRQLYTSTKNIQFQSWCEIQRYDNHFISGFLTFSLPISCGFETVPFVFDIKRKKLLTEQDVFQKKSSYKTIIDQKISEKKKQLISEADDETKSWIQKTPLSYLTLLKEGVCLSSEFHPTFGRLQVCIPFEQIFDCLESELKNTPTFSLK